MDKPMIGIRQADGSFYEIMDDAHGSRKRLVLSAARTDQHGVRIDLYRSTDGVMANASSLGTIALDDPDGLGFQDIEFRVDLDDEGQLEASAKLPGQPPRTLSVDLTPYRDAETAPDGPRSDADILADDTLADAELDTLDDSFTLEPEPMTLDLPEVEDFPEMEALPEVRSDADILADDTLDDAELDTLEDFDLDEAPEAFPEGESLDEEELTPFEPELGGLPGLDELPNLEDDLPRLDDLSVLDSDLPDFDAELPDLDSGLPDLDGEPVKAAESFDLGDLDAGFGSSEPEAAPSTGVEEWERISLDDLEPMEFMDTGDEISKPKSPARAPSAVDEFRMDDDQPLELGDLDSDLSELPDLDTEADFAGLEEVNDEPAWAPDPIPSVPGPASKTAKAPKAEKARPRPTNDEEMPGGLDKTALFLSLSALSLLVLLILVLLFLNMIKAPAPPVIQPEVMRWKPAASLAASGVPVASVADLGSADAPTFEAASVLEVPEALRGAKVTMRLAAGDTLADAERRFGPPARVEGTLLSW